MAEHTCPTVEEWERYLLDPKSVDFDDLDRHRQSCSLCRFTVSWLERELDGLKDAWIRSGKGKVYIFMPVSAGTIFETGAGTVLAAQGEEETAITVSVTMVSPDQQVFLRAVRDGRTGETWMYLLTEDPALYRNVLIQIGGEKREYITDEYGRVNMGQAAWPEGGFEQVEVYLPKARFVCRPIKDFERGRVAVLQSDTGQRIEVTLAGEERNHQLRIRILDMPDVGRDSSLKVGIRTEGGVSIVQDYPWDSTGATVEGSGQIEEFEIYLYQ